MREIYAASDVCLVPQAAATGCDAIPSKVYRILACGRPIIASTEGNSDLVNSSVAPERALLSRPVRQRHWLR